MEFKYLTDKEFEALTEYQREKYLDQKREHEAKVAKDNAEKAAKDAVDKAIEDYKANAEKQTEEKIEAAVKVVKDEYDVKVEKAVAEMKRAKVAQDEMRGIKTMQDEMLEKLSTDEGQAMVKAFLNGDKSKLNLELENKAVAKPTGPNGSGVAPQFTGIVGPGHDEWHARNAIPVFGTSSDLIKYIQFTTDPNAAGFGMTAEGTQKPSLGYIPTVQDAPVRKIAGLLDVTDEFNDDVVGATNFWSYELPQAYYDAEDLQIFKGDGTGQNLNGLWTQASAQTLPLGLVSNASNVIDKIVAAQTEVRKSKRNTTAVFLSPEAYQEILINKDDENAYTYPIHFGNDNVLRIGNLPIMWSNVFTGNEGLIGDFARGTAIYQRQSMSMRYFEENKDNVEKNIVTIRLEGRIALPIYYPESFKKLTLLPTT